MSSLTLSPETLKSYLRDILDELADLAEASPDTALNELALRLRLIAAEPLLRPVEAYEDDEVLLSCDVGNLRLVKSTRTHGAMALRPSFRLDCPEELPAELAANELSDETAAVRAFMSAKAWLEAHPHVEGLVAKH